jgi:hypothetical protein
VDIENIVRKYTGHEVSWTDLLTTHDHPLGVLRSHAVERAAYAVGQVDEDLTRICANIGDTVEGVRRVVAAAPGEPVRSLNSLGELQANGPRIDALIAARDDRISHLRIITALWRKFAGLLAPADLPVALAEAGFAPITPAHSSTRAAYGQRHGGGRLPRQRAAARRRRPQHGAGRGPTHPGRVRCRARRTCLLQPAARRTGSPRTRARRHPRRSTHSKPHRGRRVIEASPVPANHPRQIRLGPRRPGT